MAMIEGNCPRRHNNSVARETLQLIPGDQIDPRLTNCPDTRGPSPYPENTTAGMLESLAKIPNADIDKVQCIEAGTEAIDPATIEPAPHLCLIDGEHTDAATLRDARFCLSV